MGRPFGPWFRDRPRLAVAVAVALFGLLAASSIAFRSDQPLIAVGLVLPVSLLAVAFGRRGGIVGGLAGMAFAVIWSLTAGHASERPAALASSLTLLLIGALIGEAVDEIEASEHRTRMAQLAQHQAEQIAERRSRATEVNDAIVQGVAAAKWALEAGNVDRAVEVLDETVGAGQRMVSELLRVPSERCVS